MQTPKIKCCIKLEKCKIQTLTPVVSEFWTWLNAWKEKFFIVQHLFSRWQGRVTLCHKGCWKRANNTRLMTSASRFCNSSILSCHTAVSLDSSMTEDSFKKNKKQTRISLIFCPQFCCCWENNKLTRVKYCLQWRWHEYWEQGWCARTSSPWPLISMCAAKSKAAWRP